MGHLVYFVTFLTYVSVHCLRTSYSFAKSVLHSKYGFSDSFLGIVDALFLCFLGLGHLLHSAWPTSTPRRSLVVGLTLCSVNFMAITMVLASSMASWLVLLLMAINGFLQSYTWPNLLELVNRDGRTSDLLLGFWAANTNVGNILGFILAQVFVVYLQLPFTLELSTAAGFTASCAILCHFLIEERQSPALLPSA
jgi:sugar phosphate permease